MSTSNVINLEHNNVCFIVDIDIILSELYKIITVQKITKKDDMGFPITTPIVNKS